MCFTGRSRGLVPREETKRKTSDSNADAGQRERARRARHARGFGAERSRPGMRLRHVRVEQLMSVERFSHVMHLVSSLRGRCARMWIAFDALMACFPAGTVSGAPKVRAMEIIEELERTRRGIYAGGILYLDFAGNLDSCIALRTMVIKNGVAHVQAGGGLVADSTPLGEYEEREQVEGLAAGTGSRTRQNLGRNLASNSMN